MKDRKTLFSCHEAEYFKWSNQTPPPEVWQKVEKPALEEGISEAIAQKEKNIKVLDVGVGGGKVLGLLENLGVQDSNIVGIDTDLMILKLVHGVYPNIELRKADISNTSVLKILSDKTPFQLVTIHMVLNHLDDNQLKFSLGNIFNLLGDGGIMVGLVPYPNRPDKLQKRKDSPSGYYWIEDAPWGGEVTHHHRAFVEYSEYLDLSGFYPHLTAYDINTSSYPNRLLIIGKKDITFKQTLKRLNLDPSVIDRHAYLPDR